MRVRNACRLSGMVLGLGLVAGCASGGGATEMAEAPMPAAGAMAATPEMIAEGEQIFSGRCATCHGQGAVGGRFGPDLTDDEWLWIDPASPTMMADVAELIRTGVVEGRQSAGGMPPMGGASLTDDQLNSLAAYILSL